MISGNLRCLLARRMIMETMIISLKNCRRMWRNGSGMIENVVVVGNIIG